MNINEPLKLTVAQLYHLGQKNNCNKDATWVKGAKTDGTKIDQPAYSFQGLTPKSGPNSPVKPLPPPAQLMQSPGGPDSTNHKKVEKRLRPDPVTPVKEKSAEITLVPVPKRKTTVVKERVPCTSKPTANTVKNEKKIKQSEPADVKPQTSCQITSATSTSLYELRSNKQVRYYILSIIPYHSSRGFSETSLRFNHFIPLVE